MSRLQDGDVVRRRNVAIKNIMKPKCFGKAIVNSKGKNERGPRDAAMKKVATEFGDTRGN